MKKLIVAISILLLAMGMLLANGASESGKVGAEEGLTTITFWYNPAIVEAGPPPKDWFVYDIIREELGINLELTMLPADANDRDMRMLTAGAANNLPDMMSLRRPVMVELQKQGLIAEVDDMFELMPDRTSKMYSEDSIKYATLDGHVYGFAPSTGDIKKNEGILIRKDWLDNLGLDIPRTLDEYMEVMRAFTYNDPDGNGKNDTYGYGCFMEITSYEEGLGRRVDPFFGAFGCAGTWDLSKETPGLNIRKPEYYDALQFINQMCKEGVIDPNWISQRKDDFKTAWKSGRFGIMREQHSSYASESNYAPFDANFPDGEWIVIDPPVGPEGKSAVGVYTNVNDGVITISERAASEGKKPIIAKLLEWMAGPGYYMIGWGEEGVNFTLTENGVPVTAGIPDPSKGFTKSEMQPLQQLKGLAFYWGDAELESRYPTYTTAVSGKEMSALKTLREMQARPWIKQAGVDIMPLPGGDLKRYYEQSVAEFVSGNKDLNPQTWNAFIEQFDKLGGKAWEEEGIKVATENNLLY